VVKLTQFANIPPHASAAEVEVSEFDIKVTVFKFEQPLKHVPKLLNVVVPIVAGKVTEVKFVQFKKHALKLVTTVIEVGKVTEVRL
jgi:hypothetical protein